MSTKAERANGQPANGEDQRLACVESQRPLVIARPLTRPLDVAGRAVAIRDAVTGLAQGELVNSSDSSLVPELAVVHEKLAELVGLVTAAAMRARQAADETQRRFG